MICFPNIKINIGLNIFEKRSDGFHNLESVFYPVMLRDAVEAVMSTENVFQTTGIPVPGKTSENLLLKAYQLIRKDHQLPALRIHLHKIIPMGAGLGGGSADGTFFIRLLNDYFKLGMTFPEMHSYAKQLGSDCPFFLHNQPAIITGRGECIEPINLDLSSWKIVIVYPYLHISTTKAFQKVKNKYDSRTSLKENILNIPVEQWRDKISNDFEEVAITAYQQLGILKKQLYNNGSVYASMTGSGSAFYGLYKEKIDWKEVFPEYYVWTGQLT